MRSLTCFKIFALLSIAAFAMGIAGIWIDHRWNDTALIFVIAAVVIFVIGLLVAFGEEQRDKKKRG